MTIAPRPGFGWQCNPAPGFERGDSQLLANEVTIPIPMASPPGHRFHHRVIGSYFSLASAAKAWERPRNDTGMAAS